MARIASRITTVVLTLSFAVLALVAAGQLFSWWRFAPVLSGSMSGFVEAGDVAVLRPVHASDLGVGQVLAFTPPIEDAPKTLHRVVEIIEGGDQPVIRTKGDANASIDPWTAQLADEQLSVATARIPWLGHPAVWLQQPGPRIAVLGLATALVLVLGLRRIWSAPEPAENRPATVVLTAGPLALVAILAVITWRPLAAGFTSQDATGLRASTLVVSPPSALTAAVTCVGNGPQSVDLSWLPAGASGTDTQVVERRTSGDVFAQAASLDASTGSWSDSLTGVAPTPSWSTG